VDDGIRWVRTQAEMNVDTQGKLLSCIGTVQDVTHQHQMEESLRAAKQAAEAANSAKSTFLANMSHEIRTPMNAMLGLTQLVLEGTLTAQQRDYLNKVLAASQVLLNLLNDILDYSKIEAGYLHVESVRFNLNEVVENVLALFSQRALEKGLRLRTELGATVPAQLLGDALRLGQVLNNLVGNALKFTEQGEIRLVINRVAMPAGERLLFQVHDTGMGLSTEQMNRLFAPFSQADDSISRRFGGTGLGLMICKRLVALMQGEMSVESELGQGSVFSFSLPLLEPAQAFGAPATPVDSSADTAGSTNSPPVDALRGAHILLVDDDATNRLLVKAYLTGLGVQVSLAENGLEAVERVSQQTFDAILMDVLMPVMDGYTATRKIRELPAGRTLPIIALTASAMLEDQQTCLNAGMNDHVAKPINTGGLHATLVRWVNLPVTDGNDLVDLPYIAVDFAVLMPLLVELEQMLAQNMLKARHRANDIETLLQGSALLEHFRPVVDSARKMQFKVALIALRKFNEQFVDVKT
jgi:signal transduction histidine kinase/ActR/RegA family two-component response regulator